MVFNIIMCYYFRRHVLELTDSIEDLGVIRWQLVITLMLAWVCVFFCLFKGVRVLGPVSIAYSY